MTEPTPAQLDALLDRAYRNALSYPEAELLSATVRKLVTERDQRVRDLHRPWVTVHGTHCAECSHLGVEGTALVGRVVDMPCPTLRALDADRAPLTDHQPKEQA